MASGLPANFFDAAGASSASLSGREHAVEGFFDKQEDEQVGGKRKREEEDEDEDEMGADGMEEAGEEEDDETRMNKMLDQAEGVEIMDIHQVSHSSNFCLYLRTTG